jgi:hypothetical protein
LRGSGSGRGHERGGGGGMKQADHELISPVTTSTLTWSLMNAMSES